MSRIIDTKSLTVSEVQETMQFHDKNPGFSVGVEQNSDPTMKQGSSTSDDLATFLRRPIRLHEYTWTVGDILTERFNLWDEWRADARVKEKINNYYLFKGNLHVKVVINATPFHYGKIMASYAPLIGYSDITEPTITNNNDFSFAVAMSQRSQRMNVKLDTTTSSSGTLVCPFLWAENYLEIPDGDSWANFGDIRLDSMMPLSIASTSTDSVTVSVFVWAEDVELHIPTNSIHPEGDEFEDVDNGVISGPAAAVAKATSVLKNVPPIKPFAMAASSAASTVGKFANALGFSKPPMAGAPTKYNFFPVGENAPTSGGDCVSRLTMDTKQEVTIDPSVVGLGPTDELTIGYIAQRESYLTHFEWKTSDTVDSSIFYAAVTPMLANANDVSGVDFDYLQPTALSFATTPFGKWSGTLIFRFEIMASQYHRGRLRFAYDPWTLAGAQSNNNFNTTYQQILDLSETRNFEIAIPYMRSNPNCEVAALEYLDRVAFKKPPTQPGVEFVGQSRYSHNGFFSIDILNELVAPVTTADVRINVYIRAGDDFEVYDPQNSFHEHWYKQEFVGEGTDFTYSPEGDDAPESVQEKDVPLVDQDEALVTTSPLFDTVYDHTEMKSMIFNGDPVVSFRSLLKRWNFHGNLFLDKDVLSPSTTGSSKQTYNINIVNPNFPSYAGYLSDAVWTATAGPYGPYQTTLLNYLTPAYVMRRGGLRNKYVPLSPSSRRVNKIKVSRATGPTNWRQLGNVNQSNNYGTDWATMGVRNNENDHSGGIIMLNPQNPVVAFETPYYGRDRFYMAGDLAIDSTGRRVGRQNEYHNFNYQVSDDNDISYNFNSAEPAFARYVAAADDFSLHYFLNAPFTELNRNGPEAVTGQKVY